jgi:transposase-like protein
MSNKITISAYQFMKMFPDEQTARSYLEKRRWHGKTTCPFCGCEDRIQVRTVIGYYLCLKCREVFTVRTRTVMERSHIPLNKWIYTMYLMMTARKGISSLQLSKELGITQKSAWFILHRLRETCKDDKNLLSGIVEADETYIGGKESNKHKSKKLNAGRGAVGKVAVLGMKQRNGNVKAMVIDSTIAETIHASIRANVLPESILCTDENPSYNGMNEYSHFTVNHSAKEYVDGMAHTNGIESVWSVLKRGYYGIYHNFSTKHLQKYVGEFSFRLNEGNCKIPSMDRVDSLIEKIIGKRLTYKQLKLA